MTGFTWLKIGCPSGVLLLIMLKFRVPESGRCLDKVSKATVSFSRNVLSFEPGSWRMPKCGRIQRDVIINVKHLRVKYPLFLSDVNET